MYTNQTALTDIPVFSAWVLTAVEFVILGTTVAQAGKQASWAETAGFAVNIEMPVPASVSPYKAGECVLEEASPSSQGRTGIGVRLYTRVIDMALAEARLETGQFVPFRKLSRVKRYCETLAHGKKSKCRRLPSRGLGVSEQRAGPAAQTNEKKSNQREQHNKEDDEGFTPTSAGKVADSSEIRGNEIQIDEEGVHPSRPTYKQTGRCLVPATDLNQPSASLLFNAGGDRLDDAPGFAVGEHSSDEVSRGAVALD